MQDTTSNNKRIAKNAILLYARMFVSMAIGFFTSRVVLEALGVSDFGVYNLVGGIVVMMGMINGALTGATSRFLTFGLGLKDDARLKCTFSTAFLTHAALSAIFLILTETIGLWIVNTQLVIPADRMAAANWAYQSAIISTAISITQVPYNSSITAHEHFGVFALIDIINSLLKLGIAFVVLYSRFDHLIEYSILYTMVSISIMFFYRIYCIRHFSECKITRNFSKPLLKEMMSYTSWNLCGSMSFTLYQQGNNILLNRFFGTLINASVGVALQVQGILYAFIGNITNAYSPQVIKSFAQKDYQRVNALIFMGAKLSATLTLVFSIPIIVKMEFLMGLWLKTIPKGSVEICQLLLVNNIANSLNPIAYSGICASGKLKRVNILLSIMFLAILCTIYIVLKMKESYIYTYMIVAIIPLISGQINYENLKRIMPEFKRGLFNTRVVVPVIGIAAICFIGTHYAVMDIQGAFTSFIVACVVSTITLIVLSYLILLNKSERKYIINRIHSHSRVK